VIEGAVFQHEDDDVLDLVQRRDRVVDRDLNEAGGRLRSASEQGFEQCEKAKKSCAEGSHRLAASVLDPS
jgi:hypothetical protein